MFILQVCYCTNPKSCNRSVQTNTTRASMGNVVFTFYWVVFFLGFNLKIETSWSVHTEVNQNIEILVETTGRNLSNNCSWVELVASVCGFWEDRLHEFPTITTVEYKYNIPRPIDVRPLEYCSIRTTNMYDKPRIKKRFQKRKLKWNLIVIISIAVYIIY